MLIGGPVGAQQQSACGEAFKGVQSLRDGGKLLEAMGEAARCVSVCGAPQEKYFAERCTKWGGEIRDGLPTVVLDARDESGAPPASIKISIDGKVVAEKLDGKDVEIDPGQHTFRFDKGDGKPVDMTILIKTGDKHRSVSASFEAEKTQQTASAQQPVVPAPAASTSPPAQPSASQPGSIPDAPSARSGGVPTWAWVAGGAGAASTIVGVVFATQWAGAHSDFKADGCSDDPHPTDCDQRVSKERLNEGLALGFGGVGVAALGLALYGIATAPTKQRAALNLRWAPYVARAGSGLVATGSF